MGIFRFILKTWLNSCGVGDFPACNRVRRRGPSALEETGTRCTVDCGEQSFDNHPRLLANATGCAADRAQRTWLNLGHHACTQTTPSVLLPKPGVTAKLRCSTNHRSPHHRPDPLVHQQMRILVHVHHIGLSTLYARARQTPATTLQMGYIA